MSANSSSYVDLLLRIKPRTPFLTPILADTLWGLLAWAYRYIFGENKLNEFIPTSDAPPPLLVSDAFPSAYLPRPLIPVTAEQLENLLTIQEGISKDSRDYLVHIAAAKRWMDRTLLPRDEVLSVLAGTRSFLDLLRDGIAEEMQPRPRFVKRRQDQEAAEQKLARRHNVIDRQRGGAKREDGLYTHQELHLNGIWYLYLRTTYSPDRLRPLFEFVGQNGFGKRASTGLGQFELVDDFEPHTLFNHPPAGANAFMTLSSSYVAENLSADLNDANYSFYVKRGKIGPFWRHQQKGDFIKRPLVLFKAGSIFRSANPARPWQGRLLNNVHRNSDWPIYHYGYAFPVACQLTHE